MALIKTLFIQLNFSIPYFVVEVEIFQFFIMKKSENQTN